MTSSNISIVRFKELTEVVLPALAREQRWPIRLDHCFKRICLDHAFEDVWYNHLARPAERHLTGASLARACGCAEQIVQEGLPPAQRTQCGQLAVSGQAAREVLEPVEDCKTLVISIGSPQPILEQESDSYLRQS